MPVVEALGERERVCSLALPASERWLPIARVGRFRATDPYSAEDQRVIVLDAQTEGLLALVYHEYAGLRGSICPLGIDWSSYLDTLAERIESRALSAHTDPYGVLRLEEAKRRPGSQATRASAAAAAGVITARSARQTPPPKGACLPTPRRASWPLRSTCPLSRER